MRNGGLTSDIIWITIVNAGAPVLVDIFDFWYIVRLIKRYLIKK